MSNRTSSPPPEPEPRQQFATASAAAHAPMPAGKPAPKEKKQWKAGTLTYTAGTLAILFFWLLWGDFAWSLKERSVIPVVQLMLKQLNASDMMAGLMIGSLPSAITIVLSPVISYRSDRLRSRWGRRIPYLIITTPVAALSMAALALAPALGQHLHEILGSASPGIYPVTMIVFATFWTTFEIATIAANVVFTGLINDVVPQSLLGRFYGLFRALSLIAGIVFSYFILGKSETHYEWVFIGIGLIYGIGFTIMCLKVKEGEYPPVELPAASKTAEGQKRHHGFLDAARTYFSECFSNTYYIWIFAGIAISTLAFNPVNLFSVFFAQSLNISMELFGKYIALTFFLSLIFSYPLGWLADKIHPLRASILMLVLYIVVVAWGGAFANNQQNFAIAFVLHCVLSGCFFTCSASLGQRLFPKALFAQFASVAISLTALGTMLIGPTLGALLDLTGHIYRYTYLLSCLLAVIGLLCLLVVHVRWSRLGGQHNYRPPL